jgi:hypothetical protein
LPAGGTLHVDYTAIAPKEIGGEFEQFWSKMWLRDTRAEQFELTPWESFDELLQDVDLPVIPEIAYPIDDINLWMHLVKSLPPAEAVGPCGWSNDELKALPECCIRDFVNIFWRGHESWFWTRYDGGEDKFFCQKNPVPLSMHHARPITILSSLYRLFGKFIFKVTANIWKDFFPYDISGGLPGRGVKEFAYSQTCS